MATLRDVTDGLNIFLKYEPDGEFGGATFDVLHGCAFRPEDMSPEDVQQLNHLGWHWSKENDSWLKIV